MKYIFCAAAVFVLTSFTSQAAMNKVVDEKRPPNTVKTVKIAFTGAITQNKIMALSAAIDEIAQNYKAATEIQLYLTSPGGDVDAGKMGYQIVKDSPIPVATVNMSSVESSATLIYCGAKKRLTMDDSIFLLHAPTIHDARDRDFSENMLVEKNEFNSRFRNIIKNIYHTCTNLTDDQIDKITYSEDNHMLLDNQHALAVGIATGGLSHFMPADAAYYIHDNN